MFDHFYRAGLVGKKKSVGGGSVGDPDDDERLPKLNKDGCVAFQLKGLLGEIRDGRHSLFFKRRF
jgi:hypothetical protein